MSASTVVGTFYVIIAILGCFAVHKFDLGGKNSILLYCLFIGLLAGGVVKLMVQ